MATFDEPSESLVPTYAELFPALPTSAPADTSVAFVVPKLRNVVEVSCSSALFIYFSSAQVFNIPLEEQRYRQLDEKAFGSTIGRNRVCAEVAGETDTKIEISLSKDHTLSICISGKRENVPKAKKLVLQKLQTQASVDLDIPKAHHVFLIGKEGKIVKEIMESTSTNVNIPKADDPSTIIRVSGTTENIRNAVTKLQLIADEKVRMVSLFVLFLTLRRPRWMSPVFPSSRRSTPSLPVTSRPSSRSSSRPTVSVFTCPPTTWTRYDAKLCSPSGSLVCRTRSS